MPAPPLSFLILPDPVFSNAGQSMILRDTAEASALTGGWGTTPGFGLYPDVGYPAASNHGAATLQQTGWPTERHGFRYRVLASGGVYANGTWGWRKDEDLDPGPDDVTAPTKYLQNYNGCNDARYAHHPDSPFMGGPGLDTTPPDSIEGGSRTLAHLFLPTLSREIVYYGKGSGSASIWAAYNDTPDEHPAIGSEAGATAAWKKTQVLRSDLNIGLTTPDLSVNSACIATTALRDGRGVMVLESPDGLDLDVYLSADGITWTPVALQILARFSEWGRSKLAVLNQLILVRSGDWLRIVFVWWDADDLVGGGAVYYMRSLVSADCGSTWREVSDFTTPTDWQPTLRNGGAGNTINPWLYAMAGVDNEAGQCVLFWATSTSTFRVYIASGFEPWIYSDKYMSYGAASTVHSIHAARGPEWVYFFWVGTLSATTYEDIGLTLFDPRDVTDFTLTRYQLRLFNARELRYFPRIWASANCGHYLATSWIAADDNSANDDNDPGEVAMGYLRWGGWDTMPVEERDHPEFSNAPRYAHQPGGVWDTASNVYQLWIKCWDAWMGLPAEAATSQWTLTGTLGATWRMDSVELNNANDRQIYTYTDAVLTYPWGYSKNAILDSRGGSCVEAIVKAVQSQGQPDNNQNYIGLRFEAYDVNSGSGNRVRWELRFNPNTNDARFIDPAGGIDQTRNCPNMTTRYWHWRVSVQPRPWAAAAGYTPACMVWYRDYEDRTSRWAIFAQGKLNVTAGGTVQTLEWGHLYGWGGIANARKSFWKRVGILGPHDGGGCRMETATWANTVHTVADSDLPPIELLRGRLMTNDRTLIRRGTYAQMTGGSAFMGDVFDAVIEEAYSPINVSKVDSPRVAFWGGSWAGGSIASIVYDAQAGGAVPGRLWMHNAAGVVGYRGEFLTIEYAGTTSFAGSAKATLDTRWRSGAQYRATATGNMLIIDDPSATLPGNMHTGAHALGGPRWYAKLTVAGTGGSSSYAGANVEIQRQIPGFTSSSYAFETRIDRDLGTLFGTGCSVSLFADRAAVVYGAAVAYPQPRYMRIRTDGSRNLYPSTDGVPEGQQRIGTVIPGVSLTFTVPLDWTHSDGEQGNVSTYRTTSAIRWGHSEAPPQRTWEGRVVGDINRWRETLRGYLRQASAYNDRAAMLLLDETRLRHPGSMVFGVIESGAEFSQAGYRWDGNAWIPVGDVKIKLVEEV